MPDPHRRVGHEVDVGNAAGILVRDRRRACRGGDGDLALADICEVGLKPGYHLVAGEAGDVDRADPDAGHDPVRILALGIQGDRRGDGEGNDRAEGEGDEEPDRPLHARVMGGLRPRTGDPSPAPGHGDDAWACRYGRLPADGLGGGLARGRPARLRAQDLVDQIHLSPSHVRSLS